MNHGFILHFPLFPLPVLSSWDRKLAWVDNLPDAYFIIPEPFLLLLYISDAANLKWLIYNSPDVLSTRSLWQGSCQRGFFSPAITLSVIRPSTCPRRKIIKPKSIIPLSSAACAGQQALQPGFAPDHYPVKLPVAYRVYARGKLPDDGKHGTERSDIFFQENRRAARTHMTGFLSPSSCSASGFPARGQPGLWLAPLCGPPATCLLLGSSSAPFPCTNLHRSREPKWYF